MTCLQKKAALLVLACAVAAAPGQALSVESHGPEPVIHLHVFLAENCPHCELVKLEALARLAKRTGCTIRPHYVDIDDPDNYGRLVLLERQYGDTGNELPVVFVGERVLGGVKEIEAHLESVVRELARSGGAPAVPLPSAAEAKAALSGNARGPAVHVVYFEQPGCRQCRRVEHLLRHAATRWPSLRASRFSVTRREHKLLLEALCQQAGVPEARRLAVPAMFVGPDALIQEQITDAALRRLIQDHGRSGGAPLPAVTDAELAAARERLVRRAKAIGLTAVLVGGLVDGVNPCAFATVVFFVSYLAGLGRTRKRILQAGLAFCTGVFLAYFAAGAGLSEALFQLEAVPVVAIVLRWGLIGLVALLALLSFYDAWAAWRGQPRAMLLKIPSRLRARMHVIVSRYSRSRSLLPASFLLALTISLIELACTGQVYLPLIQLMLSLSVDRLQTLGLLLAYNAAFCVPLLAVFAAAFFGASSDRLNAFLAGHIAPAKVLLGLFLAVLAGTLVLLG